MASSRPAAASARRVSWAVSSVTQAAANAAGSPGGTTTPPRPAASGIPPTSVTTVGRPAIAASMTVNGSPSDRLDCTTTCPASNA
jgi:hypothetical protein